MKKVLFMIFTVILFCGCDKDSEKETNNSYLTEYVTGREYSQTFYYGGNCGYISSDGGHNGSYFESICGRLRVSLYDYDSDFATIDPTRELKSELEELNKNSKNKELKYYLTANIHFLYSNGQIQNLSLITDWKIVIGKMEEYVYNKQIYNRLIVIE